MSHFPEQGPGESTSLREILYPKGLRMTRAAKLAGGKWPQGPSLEESEILSEVRTEL